MSYIEKKPINGKTYVSFVKKVSANKKEHRVRLLNIKQREVYS